MSLTIALGALAAAVSQPLPPSGNWNLGDNGGACRISRTYGDGSRTVVMTIEHIPSADFVTFELKTGANDERPGGRGRIWFPGTAVDHSEALRSLWNPVSKARFVHMRIAMNELPAAAKTQIVNFEAPPLKASLLHGITPTVTQALSDCSDKLERSWGHDPDQRKRIVTPARAAPGEENRQWIDVTDYPPSALARREQGVVQMAWTIGIDGRVADCRVVISSGSEALDKASCDAFSRNRYQPALDASGNPIVSFGTRGLEWILPSSRRR